MPPSTSEIVQKIDRLDHPDGHLQEEILKELTREKKAVLPLVHANLPIVTPRARRALLRWLAEHHTAQTTLPLMRYVFDDRKTIEETTGRVLAMGILFRRSKAPDSPEEVGRLRAFAEDMLKDHDSDIRVFALRILASAGNQRSIPYVEDCRRDQDLDVRAAADATLDVLLDSPDGSGQPGKAAADLLHELVEALGPRRQQLVRQWRRHPEKSTIAVELIRSHRALRSQALQILVDEPREEVRAYLPGMVLDRTQEEVAALALRVMGKVAGSDVRSDEVEAVRVGLRADDILIHTAAIEAAGEMDLKQFFGAILESTLQRDAHLVFTAAKSLNQLATANQVEAIGALIQSIEINERRRQEARSEQRTSIVAYLQSALQKCTHPALLQISDIQRLAITQLVRGHQERSIRFTALQILHATIPEEGSRTTYWHPEDIKTLMDYVEMENPRETRLLAKLLLAFAPERLVGLPDYAKRIWQSGHVSLVDCVLPLLMRAEIEEATPFLTHIAQGEHPEAAQQARDLLRKERNQAEFIDADFIPASRKK